MAISLDFTILCGTDPRSITIIDVSKWGSIKDDPAYISITLPDTDEGVESIFRKRQMHIYNSINLGVSCLPPCDCEDESEYLYLPDGLYKIKIEDRVNSYKTITLTGTGGTANITINGVDYLVTFDKDLETTATNFVTTHAGAILVAHELTVTAEDDILTFTGKTVGFLSPSIANATDDLAGTVGSLTGVEGTYFKTKYYLRTTATRLELDKHYVNAFAGCEFPEPSVVKRLHMIEMLLAAAEANVRLGFNNDGNELFEKATKLIGTCNFC